ncbi:MAG: M28 family peptidase [Planctomycetes bacterium]|nr:M28 family peptidase [Planctomycetota bacterium]
MTFDLPLPTEDDLGKRAYAHVARIAELGPRHPGSKARERAADLIFARLRALDLAPMREAWFDEREKIRFENVRCRLTGNTNKCLLITTHYDTKLELPESRRDGDGPFVGVNDGGSGTGLLLALAEEFAAAGARRPTLELVWFDGEESIPAQWDLDRALYGSREFVRRHLQDGHTYGAMILLDMVGAKDLCIDREENSSKELFAPFEAAVKRLGYDEHFFQTTCDVDDDHVPFLEAGLPSIDLIQFDDNPHWHRNSDTLEHVSPRSLGIVGRVVLAALPAIAERVLQK